MINTWLCSLAAAAICSSTAFSQGAPAFEVASVRPASPGANATMTCQGGPGTPIPARLTCANAPLKMLIGLAYDLRFYQVIDAPEWTTLIENSYNVSANIPAGATAEQYRLMLQSLLSERFQLKLHHERRDFAGFSLAVAKGGVKMKSDGDAPAQEPSSVVQAAGSTRGSLRITGRRIGLKTVAKVLEVQLQSPVVDNTSLDGDYNFVLEFIPPRLNPDFFPGVNLFDAVDEQLGLNIRPQKISLDTLVFESAQQVPTAN